MSENTNTIERATDAQTTAADVEETVAAGQSQSDADPDQDKTAGGSTDDPPQPEKGKAAGKGGKTNATAPKPPPTPPPPAPAPKPVTKVRVVCEGTLGHLFLTKGQETSDPKYVAILRQKGQKKVELVK